jgi:hypothetical protein
MNIARIVDIKERIAISDEWKPEERDFILDCINGAVEAQRQQAARVLFWRGRPEIAPEELS